MPKKKSQPNGFFYFVKEMKPELQRQGVVIQNGMDGLVQYCGPLWQELSDDVKSRYKERAKEEKYDQRQQAMRFPQKARTDRMDCTGQYISQRVDVVKLNEDRRRKQRQEVVANWPPGEAVCNETFYLIGFMTLVEYPDNRYQPCEVGLAEFTLRGGIIRTYHSFIHPGDIEVGHRYNAMSHSEKTHQIPLEGLAQPEDTYRKIWTDILNFVNPQKKTTFPPVYCRAAEANLTEYSLVWLSKRAELPNKLRKVYELEGLVCDLHAYSSDDPSHVTIHKATASDLLSTTVFDFEPAARCSWHEEKEVKHCALGTVKRACYSMADFLCPFYKIAFTSKHLPERPDGASCTIITYPSKPSSAVDTMDEDDDWSRNSGPYASRDIRYKNKSSTQSRSYVPRRGPTYQDEAGLLDTPTSPVRPTPAQQATQPQQSNQACDPVVLKRVLGRGRGRIPPPNRAIIPGGLGENKPPVQPQIEGVIGGKTMFAQQIKSDLPSGLDEGVTKMNLSQEEWPRIGRGAPLPLRAPVTRPKAWAGAANPPPPSQAPLPPSSWFD